MDQSDAEDEGRVSRIDQRAIERVSGPMWLPLRPAFIQISEILLSVHPDAVSELTTIYVKYGVRINDSLKVYAVAWLQKSSEILVGLALPAPVQNPKLLGAPKARSYPRLTAYFIVKDGDAIPQELKEWVEAAYANIRAE